MAFMALRAGKRPWKAKKEKFHTCGGPRRRPGRGQGRGRRISANDCPRSLLYYYISSLSQQIPIIFINSYPLIPCSPHIPSFPHDPSGWVRKTWNSSVGFMLPLSTLIAKVGRLRFEHCEREKGLGNMGI